MSDASPRIPVCPRCRHAVLDLVQPDTHAPDVVFGTCPDCGALFGVAHEGGGAGADDGRWRVTGRAGLLSAG